MCICGTDSESDNGLRGVELVTEPGTSMQGAFGKIYEH
jgi:hypothetical protein